MTNGKKKGKKILLFVSISREVIQDILLMRTILVKLIIANISKLRSQKIRDAKRGNTNSATPNFKGKSLIYAMIILNTFITCLFYNIEYTMVLVWYYR